MKKILFYIKIYKLILVQDIKSKLAYQTDFIISIVGIMINNFVGFVGFWIIFKNFPSVAGWGYYELIFMYAFSLLALTPAQCFFDNNWNLPDYIFSGEFIKYCLRPVNIYFYFMSEVFDIKGIGQFFMGIILIIYAWINLNIEVTIINIGILFLNFITASIFMISIINMASATCFYILNSDMVLNIVFKFKDYARYPIVIFGPILRFTFTFIIPIAFISYYPCMPLLRDTGVPILSYIAPFFGLTLYFISYKLWMKGAISYNGTGS